MIKRVTVDYLKLFQKERFDLSDCVVLAGPNNSGKSTLLQAVAAWHLALKRWLVERGPESGSKARKRTGVSITRREFTAIPLREMNLLWTDRSTALHKDELGGGQKPGTPRILKVLVEGSAADRVWALCFEFTYQSPELVYARPAAATPIDAVFEAVKDVQVVHVPPFSGIGPDETGHDRPYQDLLIGQGKPGDILRNLLLELYCNKRDEWERLCADVAKIFGYQLLAPMYNGRPYIVCEYRPGVLGKGKQRALPKLDIASAGSGFLQVLMLLAFFYARPASTLLLDEPDAHLHVILQKQVYDSLREIARRRGCQLLIATHSEVLVDSTHPEQIMSFFGSPHRLVDVGKRDQISEALKRATSLDLLMAQQALGVLYVESESDLNLLREWAQVLEHPAYQFLSTNPFWRSSKGSHPREARAHFFSLRAVNPQLNGVLVLDGDNRRLPDHEVSAEGLTIVRWKRYEAESYLIHPEALARFVRGAKPDLFRAASAGKGLDYLKKELPPRVYEEPLGEHDYLAGTPASKTLLPGFFDAAGVPLTSNDYYQVAARMLPQEIAGEVVEKLDVIAKALRLGKKEELDEG